MEDKRWKRWCIGGRLQFSSRKKQPSRLVHPHPLPSIVFFPPSKCPHVILYPFKNQEIQTMKWLPEKFDIIKKTNDPDSSSSIWSIGLAKDWEKKRKEQRLSWALSFLVSSVIDFFEKKVHGWRIRDGAYRTCQWYMSFVLYKPKKGCEVRVEVYTGLSSDWLVRYSRLWIGSSLSCR